MKILYLLPILAVLTNCTTTKTVVSPPEVVTVAVPVSRPAPKPPVVERPVLAINKLSDQDKLDRTKVAQAAVISINQLILYSTSLEKYLDVYR